MTETKWPPLNMGTKIRTYKPNWDRRRDWTDDAWAKRRWGVIGIIEAHHDSHGLYYDVRHEDGTMAGYDPGEFDVLHEPTIHYLKSWTEYYRPVVEGKKTFEVRKGEDRVYRVGDYIDLKEVNRDTGGFTGAHATREVTYVMHGGPWLPPDVWILGLKIPDILTTKKVDAQ